MKKEFNPQTISLIVGLGNPHDEYAYTFHNVGKYIVSMILQSTTRSTPLHTFQYAKLHNYILVLPQTYMNESGLAVRDALAYFKHTPESLLVIHDDADLPIGSIRLQFGRGDAGHNGVKSIIATLATKQFWRLRVGIRKTHETIQRIKAESFVLSRMNEEERAIFASHAEYVKKLLLL